MDPSSRKARHDRQQHRRRPVRRGLGARGRSADAKADDSSGSAFLSHEATQFAFKALSEGVALPEVARKLNEEWGDGREPSWDAAALDALLVGGGSLGPHQYGLHTRKGIYYAELLTAIKEVSWLVPDETPIAARRSHVWEYVTEEVDDLLGEVAEAAEWSPTALTTLIIRDFLEGTSEARRELGLRPGQTARDLLQQADGPTVS